MKTYRSYLFKTKDPVIDELRTMIEDNAGKKVGARGVLQEIEKGGGPTVSCMRGWFFGKTKRPQNPTVEAAGRSIGYKRTWVKMTGRK